MSQEERDAHREKMAEVKAEQDANVKKKLIKRGVVIVLTGDGKGKSTSGFGTAIRAAGHGQRVGVVQFIKGTWKTGEQAALKRFPEIEHIISGDGFTWNTQDREQDIRSAETGWGHVTRMIEASRGDTPEFQVLVLDEICYALSIGLLDEERVAKALRDKPTELSIVLTGRGAPQTIMDAADTVSRIEPIKHAFEQGIRARRGVEF